MEIVKQSRWDSCVACVLAMMVGEDEKYVLDWFEHIDPPFNDEDAMIFLAHHGIYLGIALNVKGRSDKGIDISGISSIETTISLETHRAYMIVDSPSENGRAHAVFWDKNRVLDPLKDSPQKLSKYKVRYVYPMMTTSVRNKIKNSTF